MNLEPVIQSEVSWKEKGKFHTLTHTYMESRKMALMDLFSGQQLRNRPMDTAGGEERVRGMESVTWELTIPYIK